MLDQWLEKLKLLYRSRPEHRKAIVRLMVAVVTVKVLVRCLGRAMTWHRRKVLAQMVSLILVFVLPLGMIFKSEENVGALQSREETVVRETIFNVKENEDSSVHLELNMSSVQRQELPEDNEQMEIASQKENKSFTGGLPTDSVNGKRNQVVRGSSDRAEQQGNVVASPESRNESNMYPLSLIQGTYENQNQEVDIREKTMRYQTPVNALLDNYYQKADEFGIPNGSADNETVASGAATMITTDDTTVASGGGASAEISVPSGTPMPEIQFSVGDEQKLSTKDYDIYCTNSTDADVSPVLGAMQYHCLYDGAYKVLFEQLDKPEFQLPKDFYGSVMVIGKDEADHTMAGVEKYYLIEDNKPEIALMEGGNTHTAPYTLWVDISDIGPMVSGIQRISCKVNGKAYEITDMDITEYTSLGKSLEVPSKCHFPVNLQQEGTYDVEIAAEDYAGNETVKQSKLVVSKPELVSVYIQDQFKIHIDPQQLQKREQIYTDDIMLANVSEFDVKVKVDNIVLSVKDEEFSDVIKDCTVYFVAPDTGKKIKLSKGDNQTFYTFTLSAEETNNEMAFRFVGDITDNSDEKWKDSDIAIDIQMSFEKA